MNLRTDQYASSRNLDARLALHQRFSTNPYGWHRWVFDRLLAIDPRRILEIGCGAGTLWHANADRLPAHWRVLLSDFSVGMVAEARRSLPARQAFAHVVFDATAFAVADCNFDCVVANHMLYHVTDRAAALRAAACCLKDGGSFIAATNGAGHLGELDSLARRHGFALDALSSARFTLENGGAQVDTVFDDVRCEIYDDSLEVTEAEPLVAYVLSAMPGHGDVEALRREVENEIAVRGVFRIRKEAGVFCARKRE